MGQVLVSSVYIMELEAPLLLHKKRVLAYSHHERK